MRERQKAGRGRQETARPREPELHPVRTNEGKGARQTRQYRPGLHSHTAG